MAIGERYKIKIYDPALEIRRSFEVRLEEGNFTSYFLHEMIIISTLRQ